MNTEDTEIAELEAEKAKIEKDIQKQMINLRGILTLNDDLFRQNSEKDTRIDHREKVLKRLVEQNKEDYSQL
jgi:hypothetical protein